MHKKFKPSWVDVGKSATIKEFIHPDFVCPPSLEEAIQTYHDLPKDRLDMFDQRCSLLRRIAFTCNAALHKTDLDKMLLSGIAEIAHAKMLYLSDLKTAYQNQVLVSDKYGLQEGLVYNKLALDKYTKITNDNAYDFLVLNNDTKYHSKNGSLWGDYWMELVDPAHRALDNYKMRWLDETGPSNRTPFFLWLETHPVDPHHKSIQFLTGEELKNQNVTIIDGRLHQNNVEGILQPLNTEKRVSKTIFIITQDYELLAIEENSSTKHVSLSNGRTILGAGVIETDARGALKGLESNSGHYLPSIQNGVQLVHLLKKMNVNLSENTPFSYFYNYSPRETNIGCFLDTFSHQQNNQSEVRFSTELHADTINGIEPYL